MPARPPRVTPVPVTLPDENPDPAVISTGADFEAIATSSMGEPIMATPALSDGVMFVRAQKTLFAIGKR